jgi:hypothetical protein
MRIETNGISVWKAGNHRVKVELVENKSPTEDYSGPNARIMDQKGEIDAFVYNCTALQGRFVKGEKVAFFLMSVDPHGVIEIGDKIPKAAW